MSTCSAVPLKRPRTSWVFPNEERADWAEDAGIKLDPNADTTYFVGCLSSFREVEIAQAVGKVLNILDIPFNILGEEESCCGNPMLMMGNLILSPRSDAAQL